MSSINSYFIRLTPLNIFFFGGEKNFGADDDAEPANYLVKSRLFPQQTALLGLIRHCLLLENSNVFDKGSNKISDKKEAAKLIGRKGFRLDKKLDDFGLVRQISPLFIYRNEEQFFSTKWNDEYSMESNPEHKIWLNGTEKTSSLLKKKSTDGKIEAYKDKEGAEELLISQQGNYMYYESSNPNDWKKRNRYVFLPHEQVGILKNRRAKEDSEEENSKEKDGFFKQTFYQLNQGFSFGFHLQLDKQALGIGEFIVNFGGENSNFKMEVCQQEYPSFDTFPSQGLPQDDLPKIVLISDSYVKKTEIEPYCDFILGEAGDFRFLKTSTDTTHFYNLSRNDANKKEARRSKKYRLLKKGTILYIKNGTMKDAVATLADPLFQKIGYNHFTIVNK